MMLTKIKSAKPNREENKCGSAYHKTTKPINQKILQKIQAEPFLPDEISGTKLQFNISFYLRGTSIGGHGKHDT